MRKLIGGVGALGVATAGVLALARPGSAETEAPPLVAEITVSGNTASISSIENCPVTEGAYNNLSWKILDSEDDLVYTGTIQTEDGSWSLDVDLDEGGDEDVAAAAAAEAESRGDSYGPLDFSVGEADYSFVASCWTVHLAEFTSHETLPGDQGYAYAEVDPGDAVTIAPLSNCPTPGSLSWMVLADTATAVEIVGEGALDLAADGSWELSFTAPDESASGIVYMHCVGGDGVGGDGYLPLSFVVGDAELPEQPPVRPATPIVDDPPFTG